MPYKGIAYVRPKQINQLAQVRRLNSKKKKKKKRGTKPINLFFRNTQVSQKIGYILKDFKNLNKSSR